MNKTATPSLIMPKNRSSIWSRIQQHKVLYLMLLPSLITILITKYGPMFGLYMAFTNYFPDGRPFLESFFDAEFVGLHWFKMFFTSGDFKTIMRNTLATSILSLIISFPAPIIIALALNEVKVTWFKKTVQTVSYLPYFISWVIVANIFTFMLSSEGFINQILLKLGIVEESILFFQNGKYFWFIVAFANTWKGMGYNSILYLATIAGISQEQYESAMIDGASRLKQMYYITLPALKPTIVVLLIFAISGILNAGFDQQMLMSNDMIREYADVIDTYSYRYGLQNSMFSYAAAVGMFKSVISFILLMMANFVSKKVNDQALF